MTSNTTTLTSLMESHTPATMNTRWTGINFLLVLIYGAITFLMMILFVKRVIQRLRNNAEFSRHLSLPGVHSTKKRKFDINKALDVAMQLTYEPMVSGCRYRQNVFVEDLCDNVHRMKAVDEIVELDDMFRSISDELTRPPGKPLRLHLLDVKSHSSQCLRSVRTGQLEAICDLYAKARHSAETFTAHDYQRFMELVSYVITTLRQRHNKKGKSKRAEHSRDSRRAGHVTTSFSEASSTPAAAQDLKPLLVDAS